jgi:hypothetical protein
MNGTIGSRAGGLGVSGTPFGLSSNSAYARSGAGAATALIWLLAGVATAGGQPGPGAAYDRAAAIEAICRQYAATQIGMPPDLMFNQCMSERQCRVSPGASGYQCRLPGPLSWHGGGY